MGWYPCCCKTTCPVCDCFRCGVKVRLTETPGFVCSGSYLTDDIFNGKWVQIDLDPETCEGEYIATVDTQPDITLPPSPTPQTPPFTCGTCVVLQDIMTVRVKVTARPQANCDIPCDSADFGDECQNCGYQFDVRIYVEPLITGLTTQDNEEWVAFANQEIFSEECEDWKDIANTRGFPVCPRNYSETNYFNHINLELCSSGGPILDFSDTTAVVIPNIESRDSFGVDCDGVTAGCACWWQFNPVSPQTPPCTPTTDPSFVNCIDATYGTGWQNTDWDEDGTTPSTDGWWVSGLDCGDYDTYTMKASEDVSSDFVPCAWDKRIVYDNGTERLEFYADLRVLAADEVLYGSQRAKTCWDNQTYSCTAANTTLDQDISLLGYLDYKFFKSVHWRLWSASGLLDGARFEWISQNSFALSSIWTAGAVVTNPLKPFYAIAGIHDRTVPSRASWDCTNFNWSMSKCIFSSYGSITFPTKRPEEMHCLSNHTIPDVTIVPSVPTNC